MDVSEEHFLSLKWAEPTTVILAACHRASLPENQKWAKRWNVGEAELKPRPSIASFLVENELLLILGH